MLNSIVKGQRSFRVLLLVCALLTLNNLFLKAQKIKRAHWEIEMNYSYKIIVNSMYAVINDTLILTAAGVRNRIPVDSISTFTRIRKGVARRGILAGSLIGLIFGGAIGVVGANDTGGWVMPEEGFLATGAIGALAGVLVGGIHFQ